MSLGFGDFWNFFRPNLADDEFDFQQGNRRIAGQVVKQVGESSFSETNPGGTFADMQTGGVLTVTGLTDSKRVLIISTAYADLGGATQTVDMRILRDAVVLDTTSACGNSNDRIGMPMHKLDTPTATSHVYKVQSKGSGGNEQIKEGKLTVITIN